MAATNSVSGLNSSRPAGAAFQLNPGYCGKTRQIKAEKSPINGFE